MVKLLNEEMRFFNIDNKQFNELFEIRLRPFKSRNARVLFMILLDAGEVEYLTTLDMQTFLEKYGQQLSKKEINAWLRSLQEAGLIGKGSERGKPTIIEYDDKYTFDRWSLTSKGREIGESITYLLRTGEKPTTYFKTSKSSEINLKEVWTNLDPSWIEEVYFQFSCLHNLGIYGGTLNKRDLKEKVLDLDFKFEKALSTCRDSGLIDEDDSPANTNLLSRFLSLFGLKPDGDVIFTITQKGRDLHEKLRR